MDTMRMAIVVIVAYVLGLGTGLVGGVVFSFKEFAAPTPAGTAAPAPATRVEKPQSRVQRPQTHVVLTSPSPLPAPAPASGPASQGDGSSTSTPPQVPGADVSSPGATTTSGAVSESAPTSSATP